MKYTINLNLKKPDLLELADVDALNQNSDILDLAVGNLITDMSNLKSEVSGQTRKAINLHNRLDSIF